MHSTAAKWKSSPKFGQNKQKFSLGGRKAGVSIKGWAGGVRGGGNTIRELQPARRPLERGGAGSRGAGRLLRARRPGPLSLVERCPTGNVAPSADPQTNAATMSAVAKSSKYTYRSSGGGTTDVNIEYSADLSALSRLEVRLASC